MSKLFKNYVIDIEKGIVYNIDGSIKGSRSRDYYTCKMIDCFGNEYFNIHQVIYAEANQLPKHLWPLDEKGRMYQVDHIIPVKNGGTDAAINLRLLSIKDNHNNHETLKNYSNATKGEKNPMYGTHWSEERKKKQSLLYSGENHPNFGKKWSNEKKENLSLKMKGRYEGENNHMYGKKRNDNIERFSKPVVQLNMNGTFIKEWSNMKSTKCDGFRPQNVSQCCRCKKKSHGGFKWMYKEDYEKMLAEQAN